MADKFFISEKKKKIKVKESTRYPEEEKKVVIVKTESKAIKIIKHFQSCNEFTFDYETSGLRPFAEGHFIKCISICNSLNKAYVFLIYNSPEFKKELRKLLQSKIRKIAHNIKFEGVWTEQIFGYKLNGIYWDTLIDAHVLNNSMGKKSLKDQVAIRYNITNYDGSVAPYLKSPAKEKSSHAFNFINDCPINDLLLYCGLDSLFTYRLYLDQKKEINDFEINGFKLFMDGVRSLIDIEQNGIAVDTKWYKKQEAILEKKLNIITKRILDTPEAKQYPDENFNFNSSMQLGKLLFEILGYKPKKLTPKDTPSTDEEVLRKLNTNFTKLILKFKKIKKLKNTYVAGFIREEVNGRIYPSFNLHTVSTFRSSSKNPNFQNIPIRDKVALKVTRTGIIPSKGNQLLEVDYSSAEVRVAACVTKDPAMLNYVNDPTTDMHRDVARQIFITDEVSYHQRDITKSNFIFPQFYGDYYVHCAKNLWEDMNEETKKDVKIKGFKTLKRFERHIQEIENDFWYNRFIVYAKWKEKLIRKYEQTGIVKLVTGFICRDKMYKNMIINKPIQGPAFHWLLWSMNEMNNFLNLNNMKSFIVGQIHDSMLIDLYPPEKDIIVNQLQKIMCEDIKEHWDWIIVPLKVDFDITEIDAGWNTKQKLVLN